MIEQLKEFRELVERESSQRPGRGQHEDKAEVEITRCIQIMMARQCIYPDMHAFGPSYRIMSKPENQHFFRRYFAAMGLEFYHDTRSGMIALKVPNTGGRYDHQHGRLRKDETAVLLALRITYEEAFKGNRFSETGHVETSTDELHEKLDVIGKIEIEESRLTEILELLKRKGVVKIGDKDLVEKVTPLTILPGVEVIVSQGYILNVIGNLEAAKVEVPVASVDGNDADEMSASQDDIAENTEENAEFATEESH